MTALHSVQLLHLFTLFPFAFCLPPDCIKDDCQHTCLFTSLQQLEVSAFPKRRILTEIVDPRPSLFSCLFSNTSFHSCSVFPYIINILMTWNVRTILFPVQVSKTHYAICFLNSKSCKPLPSYKSPHFQNKAKWRTYSILMLPNSIFFMSASYIVMLYSRGHGFLMNGL